MSYQGKCEGCQIRWVWPDDSAVKLTEVRCPDCSGALKRTSSSSQLPIQRHPDPSLWANQAAKLPSWIIEKLKQEGEMNAEPRTMQ